VLVHARVLHSRLDAPLTPRLALWGSQELPDARKLV